MLPSNNKLKSNAQGLRKKATKEENRLWYDFLRTCPLQFNRQKVIGNFIVDFYCDKLMLVIELDGSQHYDEQALQYDEERTAFLKGLGIEVIRFSNLDINKNFDGACMCINERIRGYDPHQSPSDFFEVAFTTASPGGSL